MGKEAKIQNAERNFANVDSVCQQGPKKVKISTGQPCFWHKKAVFDLNWILIVYFNECGKSFLLSRPKSIIFIFLPEGDDTFFRLGSSRTNTHIQALMAELLFMQTKLRNEKFRPSLWQRQSMPTFPLTWSKNERLDCLTVLTGTEQKKAHIDWSHWID